MSFRPILGIPRLTQDWGSEQHERETHWTSLFYDLMIVAALNAIAEPFEEEQENENENQESQRYLQESNDSFVLTPIQYLWLNALLQFVNVVTPWNQLNEFTSRFEDESLVGHMAFFVHCFGLASTTAGCVGDLRKNYRVLGVGIVLAKLGLLVIYSRPICFVPRTRVFAGMRCSTFIVNMAIILFGLIQYHGADDFEKFRLVLIIGTVWDWLSIIGYSLIKREDNVPLHIQSFSDRIKEVTMVIFGEAIFAIILQPFSKSQPETHFYLALGCTLWLIYTLALQEFHILPAPEDSALRRSRMFGYLWYYTQFIKQICLLGVSIGIKRAHLLMFRNPTQNVDTDTRNLISWGLSSTLFVVIMIRTYSFGYGRHPSDRDPPVLYRLKVTWWAVLAFFATTPKIVDYTFLEYYSSQPLVVLVTYGGLMTLVIIAEAAISNLVAVQYMKLPTSPKGSFKYIRHHSQSFANYGATSSETDSQEGNPSLQASAAASKRASFLLPVAPMAEVFENEPLIPSETRVIQAPQKGPLQLTLSGRGPSGGHLVKVVKPGSQLADRVQVGDELTHLNNQDLTELGPTEMTEQLRQSASDEGRSLTFVRVDPEGV